MARRELGACWGHAEIEHKRWLERPVARLLDDGSLEEIQYGPYEIPLPAQ